MKNLTINEVNNSIKTVFTAECLTNEPKTWYIDELASGEFGVCRDEFPVGKFDTKEEAMEYLQSKGFKNADIMYKNPDDLSEEEKQSNANQHMSYLNDQHLGELGTTQKAHKADLLADIEIKIDILQQIEMEEGLSEVKTKQLNDLIELQNSLQKELNS